MRPTEKYVHPTQPALDDAMLRYGQVAATPIVESTKQPGEPEMIQ